jgi:hypothetical protein
MIETYRLGQLLGPRQLAYSVEQCLHLIVSEPSSQPSEVERMWFLMQKEIAPAALGSWRL